MVKKSIDNNTQQTRTLLAIRANKNAQILVLVRFHLEGHFEICLESKQLFPVLLYFQQPSGTGFHGCPSTCLDIRFQKYVKESKIE